MNVHDILIFSPGWQPSETSFIIVRVYILPSLLDSNQVMAKCSEYALVLMMFLFSPFLMLYNIELSNTTPPDI